MDIVDNGDGVQTVNYVPSREGPYNIAVLYGDEEVPRRLVISQICLIGILHITGLCEE